MTDQGSNPIQIRGKYLHSALARHVVEPFQAGRYDDAVLNAFKAVEGRLRQEIKLPVPAGPLIDAAFEPGKGVLNDVQANDPQEPDKQPRRAAAARHNLFRGAFQLFRNTHAHGFPGSDQETAFDLIILANRLLLMADSAIQRSRSSRGGAQLVRPREIRYGERVPFMLDADNDGQLEIVQEVLADGLQRTAPVVVYDVQNDEIEAVEVEQVKEPFVFQLVQHVFLSDVDNDGANEMVCVLGWTAGSALMPFKFRNGRYELLRKEDAARSLTPFFVNAVLTDLDGDGKLEIEALARTWLPGASTSPEGGEEGSEGRLQYEHQVWRWHPSTGRFKLLSRGPMPTLSEPGLNYLREQASETVTEGTGEQAS